MTSKEALDWARNPANRAKYRVSLNGSVWLPPACYDYSRPLGTYRVSTPNADGTFNLVASSMSDFNDGGSPAHTKQKRPLASFEIF
jgi:hypothetical protein